MKLTTNKKNLLYNHQEIEKKWQFFWWKNNSFSVNLLDFSKPKKYILVMFPYPSGSGLHLGHVRNYTIADVLARFYRLLGYNVFFPIGWDSFGLPAEQYAIQTGNHPAVFTQKNIEQFKSQLLKLGFSFDWSKEISTSDPEYYKWTQWIFSRMYEQGLVDYKKQPVNWCPRLGTVLANEEIVVVNKKFVSERGEHPVIIKNISQWVLKITNYGKRLSDDLWLLDWPKNIKELQKNWIGYLPGVVVLFAVDNSKLWLKVFLERLDYIFSATAIFIPFNHPFLAELVSKEYKTLVEEFLETVFSDKKYFFEKKTLFMGSFALDTFNGRKIPLFLVSFLEGEYASLVTPLFSFSFPTSSLNYKEKEHQYKAFFTLEEAKRRCFDYEFSRKNNLSSNSVFLFKNSLISYKAAEIVSFREKELACEHLRILFLQKKKNFFFTAIFSLKDWVFCRQRYWGEPIPLIHLETGEKELEKKLPLVLPYLENFVPSENLDSPLEKLIDWVNVERNGQRGKRECQVMPQWAGSNWYYLAYLLKREAAVKYLDLDCSETKFLFKKWLPVDLYIGGAEHANLHLLYARFWHKFLQDRGLLNNPEPFSKLICQGVVLGKNKEKMSKSRGNVINPDYLVEHYGADALRLAIIFSGPIAKRISFNNAVVLAMRKWLLRVYVLFFGATDKFLFSVDKNSSFYLAFQTMLNNSLEHYKAERLNLVVSELMIFINVCYKNRKNLVLKYLLVFCKLLNPLAPHIAAEIWGVFAEENDDDDILLRIDPLLVSGEVDNLSVNKEKKIVIQINGKKRAVVFLEGELTNEVQAVQLLEKTAVLQPLFKKKKIVKVFLVKNKLVNFLIEEDN